MGLEGAGMACWGVLESCGEMWVSWGRGGGSRDDACVQASCGRGIKGQGRVLLVTLVHIVLSEFEDSVSTPVCFLWV